MIVPALTLLAMTALAAGASAQRVGDRVPTDFAIARLDGSTTSLAERPGTVRIVNVWATWCTPCIAELPSLAAMADSLRADGVQVYAVAIDDGRRVHRFLRRVKVAPPIYLEHDGFPRAWGRLTLPKTWIVGPDDRVLSVRYGAARWDAPAVLASLRALIARAEP